MTKEEHIKYWIETSEEDWKVVDALYSSNKYLYSLFFSHLLLEKLAKALWVKHNEDNFPPKIHNIVLLLEQAEIEMSIDQKKFFITMNDFQLEGRYPDYKNKIYKLITKKDTDEILSKVKQEREWLLKKLQ